MSQDLDAIIAAVPLTPSTRLTRAEMSFLPLKLSSIQLDDDQEYVPAEPDTLEEQEEEEEEEENVDMIPEDEEVVELPLSLQLDGLPLHRAAWVLRQALIDLETSVYNEDTPNFFTPHRRFIADAVDWAISDLVIRNEVLKVIGLNADDYPYMSDTLLLTENDIQQGIEFYSSIAAAVQNIPQFNLLPVARDIMAAFEKGVEETYPACFSGLSPNPNKRVRRD